MFGKPHVEPLTPPWPVALVEIEGVNAWHADTSPFSQFEVVESCCWELLEPWGDDCVCARAAMRDRATEKMIKIRKHLLMLVLMFADFRF